MSDHYTCREDVKEALLQLKGQDSLVCCVKAKEVRCNHVKNFDVAKVLHTGSVTEVHELRILTSISKQSRTLVSDTKPTSMNMNSMNTSVSLPKRQKPVRSG